MATKLKNLKVKKVDFVDQGANPEAHIKIKKNKDGAKEENLVKRFFTAIAKASGLKQEELENAIEEIRKGDSLTFGEKMNEVKCRKVADEIWDMCYALQSSLTSIMFDDDLESDDAHEAMQQSISEFSELINECIKQWSQRKISNVKKNIVQIPTLFEVEKMTELIEKKEESIKDESIKDDEKGGEEIMIDKSKMTPAERLFYEDIEKRYGVESVDMGASTSDSKQVNNPPVVEDPVTKSINQPQEELPNQFDSQDIYKGMHPAVKAELEALKKFREDAEDRELHLVAKKYELIGKKQEELIPMLKSLKAAGGTAYTDMIAILDQTLETVEKSGVFKEVGRTGGYSDSGESEAVAKMRNKVQELKKSRPDLTEEQAMDLVLLEDSELLKEFDK